MQACLFSRLAGLKAEEVAKKVVVRMAVQLIAKQLQ